MSIQAKPLNLEEIPEIVHVVETRVVVFVEGRKSRCFRNNMKGDIRAECDPPRESSDEKEEEKGAATTIAAVMSATSKGSCSSNNEEKKGRWFSIKRQKI